MKRFVSKLQSLDLRTLIVTFPFIACLHEFEEWNILQWHRTYQTNVPPDITNLDLRTIFLIINLVIILWTVLALLPGNNLRVTAYLFFPLLAVSLINALEHLIWQVEFGVYAPGFIFGFIFEAPLILLIAYRMLKDKLVSKLYSGLFGLVVAAGTVKLLLQGSEIDPVIVYIMKLSRPIADFIWK
ncbi:MAG: HXXEE domain-containing protein [Thermodesulfobacteriota bacterium]